jgi:hypothetical protein
MSKTLKIFIVPQVSWNRLIHRLLFREINKSMEKAEQYYNKLVNGKLYRPKKVYLFIFNPAIGLQVNETNPPPCPRRRGRAWRLDFEIISNFFGVG